MSQQMPRSNSSTFFLHFLVQTALTVGITLLILKYSPKDTFRLQGPAGKSGHSCQVKTVRYDPSGSAVLAFACGKNVREVTIARGKQGPTGPQGQAGAACRVTTESHQSGPVLVFQCGSQRTVVPIPKAASAVVKAAPKTRPVAARRPAPRPRAQPVARPAARQPAARRPAPRVVAKRPAPRKAPLASVPPSATNSDSPSWGPATAKVKIIEYSDFQCPFCSRAADTIKKIKQEYGDKVRLTFKHLPLSFHKDAHLAAQASMAAHAQGKFWPYHDKLFANSSQLKKADLIKYAKQLKLDVSKFKKALDSGTYKAHVDKDMAKAGKLGATGTPTFYINGKKIAGAYPYSYFKQVVEAVLAGQAIPDYAAPNRPSAPKQPKAPTFPAPDFNQVSVGNAPTMGNANAKITIVEFSDFECGFCGRALGVISQLKRTYGDKVRIAFKHLPLPFHKQAHLAAQASMAAHEQGKFWEYHDKLFANQQQLGKDALLRYAKELKLDVGKFKQALESGKYKAYVDSNMQEAQGLKIRGTPTFFVNGYRIAGAFPFFYFQQVIKAVQAGKKPPAFKPPSQPPSLPAGKPVQVNTQGSPSWGPKGAKVTIVEFSDFECSFCSKAAKTIKRIKQEYKDKLRLVFKHVPLPDHPHAQLAAQAAVEAHKQGKFWPFQEKLFAHYKSLSKEKIDDLARQVGMDMAKFKDALSKGVHMNKVNSDRSDAEKVGATNTPTFFINGYRMVGALPYFMFKRAVEAALAGKNVAKALAKRDPKKGQPAPLLTQGAPSYGPKDAKVTVVEFSDFECGFCAQAAKNLNAIKKKYGDRVRFVFKHMPLQFHKKAKPAAMAAMAAHAQGKFWEYHDLLFANQKNLGDALFIKLAKQLKLDIKKFEKDRKNPAYAQQIANDYAEGRWAGADGTPAFFINGYLKVGAIPVDKFAKTLDQALKQSK